MLSFGRLRPLKETDAACIARYANNRNVWKKLVDQFPFPYSIEDARNWLAGPAKIESNIIFGIERSNEIIGVVGVHAQDDIHAKTAEVGYWLAEPFWGRGIMTETVRAVMEYALGNGDWVRFQASVFSSNCASARVLEKCGFHCESIQKNAVFKDDRLLDEHVMVCFNERKLKELI
ncbi:GNAT family N-acetyltransferase [bacterium]|nr:GNAT family N-acetyltransferase [bacterium]